MERTKIEYIRNLKGSYMVIATECEPEFFEEKMLRYNQLEGLLIPFSLKRNASSFSITLHNCDKS